MIAEKETVTLGWKSDKDRMIMTVRTGSWFEAHANLNRDYVAELVEILQKFLKGGDAN